MVKKIHKFVRTVISRFFQEGCPLQAAGLSYVTLLSLVPLMTVSLSLLSVFPVFHGLGNEVQQLIFSHFIASSAQTVNQYFQAFMSQTAKLSVMGMISLLITALIMVFSMEQAFNRIWHVNKRRNIIQAFLTYWAVLTLVPILIGIGLVLGSYIMHLPLFLSVINLLGIKAIFMVIAPYVFTFVAFMLLYIAVPNCKVRVLSAVVGSFIATLLFEIARSGFAYYITVFPTYKLIYGALAVVPIFLVWLYLSWLIILFGAIISYEIDTNSTRM